MEQNGLGGVLVSVRTTTQTKGQQMLEVAKLKLEAQVLADLNHAEVIARVFEAERCSSCTYPENAEYYQQELRKYVHYKLLERKESRSRDYYYDRAWHRSGGDNYLYKCNVARRNMRKFDPCEDCMVKFNPHHKSKGNDFRNPGNESKGAFLNEFNTSTTTTR